MILIHGYANPVVVAALRQNAKAKYSIKYRIMVIVTWITPGLHIRLNFVQTVAPANPGPVGWPHCRVGESIEQKLPQCLHAC